MWISWGKVWITRWILRIKRDCWEEKEGLLEKMDVGWGLLALFHTPTHRRGELKEGFDQQFYQYPQEKALVTTVI